jgi:hypothetical protein
VTPLFYSRALYKGENMSSKQKFSLVVGLILLALCGFVFPEVVFGAVFAILAVRIPLEIYVAAFTINFKIY